MTSIASEATRTATDRRYTGGLVLALVSASSFGLSGSLARSLLDLGWSPAAVVATRVGGAFLILLIPTLLLLRRMCLQHHRIVPPKSVVAPRCVRNDEHRRGSPEVPQHRPRVLEYTGITVIEREGRDAPQ